MKKIAVFISAFLLIPSIAFSVISSHRVFINNFAVSYKKNMLNGVSSVSGLADVSLKKGNVMADPGYLSISYDLSKGPVRYLSDIKINDAFSHRSGICLVLKGTASAVKVLIDTDFQHEYLITDLSSKWKTFRIDFSEFSSPDVFDPKRVKRVSVEIDPAYEKELSGKLMIDSMFLDVFKKKITKHELAAASKVNLSSKDGVFKFRSKYPANMDNNPDFAGVVFEISEDKKSWFRIGADYDLGDYWFEYKWEPVYFPAGRYYVRSAAYYKRDGYAYSLPSSFEHQSEYDFDSLLAQSQRKAWLYFFSQFTAESGLLSSWTDAGALPVKEAAWTILTCAVAAENEWITKEEAAGRVDSLLGKLDDIKRINGFFPEEILLKEDAVHSAKGNIVSTAYVCWVSIIADSYFDDTTFSKSITQKVNRIIRAVDWPSALIRTSAGKMLAKSVAVSGDPEGLTSGSFDAVLAYACAIASPNRRIEASTFNDYEKTYAFRRSMGTEILNYDSIDDYLDALLFIPFDWGKQKADMFSQAKDALVISRDELSRDCEYDFSLLGSESVFLNKSRTERFEPVKPAQMFSALDLLPSLSKASIRFLFEKYNMMSWGDFGFVSDFDPDSKDKKQHFSLYDCAVIIIAVENHKNGLIRNIVSKDPRFRKAFRMMERSSIR